MEAKWFHYREMQTVMKKKTRKLLAVQNSGKINIKSWGFVFKMYLYQHMRKEKGIGIERWEMPFKGITVCLEGSKLPY